MDNQALSDHKTEIIKITKVLLYWMCLQIPGKVVSVKNGIATIDYDIETRQALLGDIIPLPGDWVIVVGRYVVDKVPEENAIESLNHWKKIMRG